MKRALPILAATGCVFLLAAVPAAGAEQFRLTWNENYHRSNAGEFKVTFHDRAWQSPGAGGLGLGDYDLGNYSPFTATYDSGGLLESYATFCVQKDQTVNLNRNYNYDGVSPFKSPGNEAISEGAAYLYEQFATGSLDGYNYENDPSGTRASDASALQNAIWYLEGDIPEPDQGSAAWEFLGLAISQFGSLGAAQADYDGSAVAVLADDKRQDLLILIGETTPVPEPAALLVWGCIATAGGLAWRRRAKRTKA